MAKGSSTLLKRLRAELGRVADPEKAPQMQAYMKSEMPYHGVPSPLLKKVCRVVFADIEIPDFKSWQNHVLDIWRGAIFREERYGALYFAGLTRAKAYQTIAAMDAYEEMIVSGAWWDYVDDIAIHRVGAVLANDPKPTKRLMLAWSRSANIWQRRTSIICQIGAKDQTDLDLLYKCIEPSIGSDEFFLRKAIGWGLRQVAWRDPDEVIRYVKKNRDRLSPLSKREALKNVIKAGKIRVVP
jgi:3-methyladenine DNA glycosylase AlkD